MIEIQALKKIYNGNLVVDIPSLNIQQGETIGLIGNNGAGKTTLFRMMLDLIRPESGNILCRGEDVAHHSAWKDYTSSYLDEGFLIDYLTPEEYFYFIGSLHNLDKTAVDGQLDLYTDFFNGEIRQRGKYIRDLSKGNQAKVGIIACLLHTPEFLMFDEPFANIDPSTQIRLKNLLKDLNQQHGVTILVSSHDLNHVTDISQRIILMEKGMIIKDLQTDANTLEELEHYFSI